MGNRLHLPCLLSVAQPSFLAYLDPPRDETSSEPCSGYTTNHFHSFTIRAPELDSGPAARTKEFVLSNDWFCSQARDKPQMRLAVDAIMGPPLDAFASYLDSPFAGASIPGCDQQRLMISQHRMAQLTLGRVAFMLYPRSGCRAQSSDALLHVATSTPSGYVLSVS